MGNLRKSGIVVIGLLLSGLLIISCSSGSADTDTLRQDGWSGVSSVSYSTPRDWSDNLPPPEGVWDTFMNSHDGLVMASVTDPTSSAEFTIAILELSANGDDPDTLMAFAESAAATLMATHNYLGSGPLIKTEISGHLAYESNYHISDSGLDFEGRFLAVAGNDDLVILTYIAPAEKWGHFSPIYDTAKSNICFATKKNADGDWEPCFLQYR